MERQSAEAYEEFARVYDLFQDNVDYRSWAAYLTEQLKKRGFSEGIVLDLGCGTGTMTELLAEAGYDMIGVDNAEEMLQEAIEKKMESGHSILYLLQDMEEFELYGTVCAVVSVCDSLNYILEEEDLLQVFRLVNNYLDPGGVFIFDMNTVYKYETVIGNSTIAENREDGSFIWENTWDPERQLNEYMLTLFLPEEEDPEGDMLYRKYEEVHLQRAYDISRIKALIEASGMIWEGAYEAYTDRAASDNSERICIIAREKGKGTGHGRA